MSDLFRAELLRFRTWGLAYLLIHAGLLGFYAQLIDPLQQPRLVHQVVAGIYALSGLLLGLYQIASYRRPATWLYLMHRPLPAGRIALALSAAGALWVVLAVGVPLLLLVLGQDILTSRVVDLRHYGLPWAAVQVAVCAYLLGGYAMLAPRGAGIAGFAVLFVLAGTRAQGVVVLLMQFVCVLVALGLLLSAWRPDHHTPPASPWQRVLIALPIALAIHLLLTGVGSLTYQSALMAMGRHALNGGERPGGQVEAARAGSLELILQGLEHARHPSTALWRNQAALSPMVEIRAQLTEPPRHGELTSVAPLEFDDAARHTRLTYSYDERRYLIRGLDDNAIRGRLGAGADHAAFAQPAWPAGPGILVAGNALYQYDSDREIADLRIELPEDESIAALPEFVGDSVFVLGTRHLYAFPAHKFKRSVEVLQADLIEPLPFPIAELERLDLFETLDGYLLSWTRGRDALDAPGVGTQTLSLLQAGAPSQRLAERTLAADFPDGFRYLGLWLSPVFKTLGHGMRDLGAPNDVFSVRDRPPIPQTLLLWIAVLHTLSAGGVWWMLRRQPMPAAQRAGWSLLGLLGGLPMLGAVWVLHAHARLRPDPSSKHKAAMAGWESV